jgi:lysophospholipase L1-like esterase
MFPTAEDTRLAQRRDDGDVPATPIDFLPLGDSYTIGISVDPADRWPEQLVRVLAGTVALRIVASPARNGLTSADLLRDELPLVARLRPGLVSVLIGVNDVVQGVSEQRYLATVRQILDQLVETPGARRVFVVATPDYTLTPQGAAFGDPMANRAAIARFNAIIREEAERRLIAYVDITPVADRVTADPTLVAADGLHPSGRQYLAWAELIAPVVEGMLRPTGHPGV